MNKLAESMIKHHEALRLKVYKCSEGKNTIAWGRNLDDVGVSLDEAELMFKNDMARVYKELSSFSFYEYMDPVRQAVLVDMCLNLGLSRLRGFRKMLAACAAKNYQAAAAEMVDSKWYHQVKSRAKTLVAMMETGDASHYTGPR